MADAMQHFSASQMRDLQSYVSIGKADCQLSYLLFQGQPGQQVADPHLCRYMQARANRFMPGQYCNSSVAVGMKQGDADFDDMAVLSRMLGKLAFDGDVASWSKRLTRRMARWVEEFKAVRPLLVQDFYQLLPMPTIAEDWDAVQFVDYDGNESAIFVFAGIAAGKMKIVPKGLDGDAQYAVTRCPKGKPRTYSGSSLMTNGLPLSLKSHAAGLWRFCVSQDNPRTASTLT